MKRLLLIFTLLLGGCDWGYVNTYDLPFVEDGYTKYVNGNQIKMCNELPDSMFCSNLPTIGDIKPTPEYARNIVHTLRKNNKYEISDDWHYTETVYEFQVRDCEDEAMTMIHHMVDEGIDKKYLFLVYQLTSATSAHLFVGIDTTEGLMHMDISTVLAPIEERINWHMRMDNAGIYTWIKGNIR